MFSNFSRAKEEEETEEEGYHNNVTYVVLLGFQNIASIRVPLFLFLFIIYCATVSGNLLIMVLINLCKHLHSPMYFFITQLSLSDIILSTNILPNLLDITLYDGCTMSLIGCICQFSCFATADTFESLLLTVMSYDRYLAICKPLHYNSIINQTFCIKSVVLLWLLSFNIMLLDSISLCNLYYCGLNIIDHFYCDIQPILEIACPDPLWLHIQIIVTGFFCILCPFIIIVISYTYIIVTILKIPSNKGRLKSFTTCSSHLMVVSIFFGSITIVYIFPTRGKLGVLGKVLSLFYTVITPLLNPIIYTFRNKDFKKALDVIKSDLGN